MSSFKLLEEREKRKKSKKIREMKRKRYGVQLLDVNFFIFTYKRFPAIYVKFLRMRSEVCGRRNICKGHIVIQLWKEGYMQRH